MFYQVSTFWEPLKILVIEKTDDQMDKVLILREKKKMFCWLVLFLMGSRLVNVLFFIYGNNPTASIH